MWYKKGQKFFSKKFVTSCSHLLYKVLYEGLKSQCNHSRLRIPEGNFVFQDFLYMQKNNPTCRNQIRWHNALIKINSDGFFFTLWRFVDQSSTSLVLECPVTIYRGTLYSYGWLSHEVLLLWHLVMSGRSLCGTMGRPWLIKRKSRCIFLHIGERIQFLVSGKICLSKLIVSFSRWNHSRTVIILDKLRNFRSLQSEINHPLS